MDMRGMEDERNEQHTAVSHSETGSPNEKAPFVSVVWAAAAARLTCSP